MQIPEIPAQRMFVSAMATPTSASLFQQCATPTPRPQTAQNCNSYSLDARIKILTEMYYSHQ